MRDLRQAARGLRRQRLVSGLAIVAFALGIGVTTAVFTIFNGVLLTPLAYPDSDRLVLVYDTQPACTTCPASFPKYHDWRSRSASLFKAIGGSFATPVTWTGSGTPERVQQVLTTASMVDVLGVQPSQGRWYTESEDQPGGPKVTVISHRFWQTRLGGAVDVMGRALTLNGEPHQIIGVMPETFAYRSGDVFVPIQRKLDPATRGNHFMLVYARLRDDVTLERAANEMRETGHQLAKEFGHNHGISVQQYYEIIVGGIRAPLQILMSAVAMVLLIACANVANLLLAAGLARRRELAIRLAMGARRAQLARLLVLEGVMLALIGGALGVLTAQWVVKVFVTLAGSQLPRAASIHIDSRVVLFAAAVSLVVGVGCGLWPLLRMRTRELITSVREADTRTMSGAGKRFGNGLVVIEVAVAFALLVGAGLFAKNLRGLEHRDAGVRTEGIIAFDVSPAGPRYAADEQIRAFYRELTQRLTAMGGVERVGLTSHLPMYSFGTNGEMTREGGNPWGPNDAPLVEYRWISGDYFQALDIPLVRGRFLDARDKTGTSGVVINQAMAEKFWPGEDAIGKRFGQGEKPTSWYDVVGVIGNTRSFGLARAIPAEFYRTLEQASFSPMTVVLRTNTGDPEALIPTARKIVSSIDPALPITTVQRMDNVVLASVGQPRFMTALSSLFGALAGLLAMVGVYGVTAYNVRRQRREFGIRLALGAEPAHVRRLVLVRGITLALSGVVLGVLGAVALGRWIESQLTDVKAADPVVYVAIAVMVAAVATVASYIPARQASRVDPGKALRDS
ncbi:MAG TPA: ABC transporter permease [Vicinamibacterales bacterium]|nr:ABC transporter permease [Vicinamibacterales bacterium]